ncbi:MAG TPA: class II glutamine amidotransferase [Bacteroidia bacterium]|nr:class II glutamine amidotransferase [Bacteroidia bacterium]
MCRMFSKISFKETSPLNEMLNCPYSLKYLSTQGRQPENPELRGNHNDGCGMAFFENEKLKIEKRDKQHAWDKSYAEAVEKVSTKVFIGHNRLTVGGLQSNYDGTHPFYLTKGDKEFAFSHNGTIYNFMDEAKARNTSDSFVFMEKLLKENTFNEEFVLRQLKYIAEETDYSSMIGFLMTADKLMVWRGFNDKDKEKFVNRDKYYTMFMQLNNEGVIFSSEPLDNGSWTLMPNFSYIIADVLPSQLNLRYGFIK